MLCVKFGWIWPNGSGDEEFIWFIEIFSIPPCVPFPQKYIDLTTKNETYWNHYISLIIQENLSQKSSFDFIVWLPHTFRFPRNDSPLRYSVLLFEEKCHFHSFFYRLAEFQLFHIREFSKILLFQVFNPPIQVVDCADHSCSP